jgi:predicted transcriptional regulator of viral defense system
MTPETQTPPTVERERGLARLATRQHGVVARRQLAALGFGEEAIKLRLDAGRLQRIHREVYAVGHRRLTHRSYWWAAVLAYGDEALLSHRSAAALWGLVRPRAGPIHVTASVGRQGVDRRTGIWIHRCKLDPEDRTTHDGIPVTTVARTLFDYAEVVDYKHLQEAAEEADRLKRLRLRDLERVSERGRGRRALRPVRRLLVELAAPTEGRSPLEIRFHEFREKHRLPEPARNVHVLGHEVDVLYPGAKLVVELDSWEHHGHRAAFERDRARDPKLLIAGYRTVRVTHRRLDREPSELAQEIRELLG